MNGLRLGTYAELEKNGFTVDQKGSVSLTKSLACSAVSGAVGSLGTITCTLITDYGSKLI